MADSDALKEQEVKATVIVLCGLIGSGKSTFSIALQREFPEFRRCNQDELGRRGDVERVVHASLSQGLSVCVDRTNIDPGQRRTWIELARQYHNVEIWGLEMDTPYDICRARLIEREDHPTIKSPEVAIKVLSRFSADFVPLDVAEGFNRVFRLSPHHSADYTREELGNILAAIRETPFFDSPLSLPLPSSTAPRGRGQHPAWGRGRGRGNQANYQSPGWRSNHQTWGPNPTHAPPSQARESRPDPRTDLDNWRNQDSASRGRGFRGFSQHRGGYRGQGNRGGYGGYPRTRGSNRGTFTHTPDSDPARSSYGSTPAHLQNSDAPAPPADTTGSSDVPGPV